MIKFNCEHCGNSMKVADSAAGKRGKCKSCGETVTVPSSDEFAELDLDDPEFSDYALPARPRKREPEPMPVNVVQQPSRASHSLGIAAMILGCLAFFICWIPLIGMLGIPLSGLGLLMGGIGVFVSAMRRGAGIGFPIAGSAICSLALFIAITVTYATTEALETMGSSLKEDRNNSDSQKDEWADAGQAVEQGDIRVSVESVTVGKVETEGFEGKGKSRDELLKILLRIDNIGDGRKVDYRSWSGAGGGFLHAANLSDDLGNSYKRVGFGFSSEVVGQVDSESIYPGDSLTDLLIFEVPIDRAEFLKLELPAVAFRGEGKLRIRIPSEMVHRE